jgi:hypothetical protein
MRSTVPLLLAATLGFSACAHPAVSNLPAFLGQRPLADSDITAMGGRPLPELRSGGLDPSAVALVIPTGLASGQQFVLLQNVKDAESVHDVESLDWRAMAEEGDTLYVVSASEGVVPVTVLRRTRVADLQGGCGRHIRTTGWLYEVNVPRSARIAIGDRLMPYRDYAVVSYRPASVSAIEEATSVLPPAVVWHMAEADAAVLHHVEGHSFPRPLRGTVRFDGLEHAGMVESATTGRARSRTGMITFVRVPLEVTDDRTWPRYMTYTLGGNGEVSARLPLYVSDGTLVLSHGAGVDVILSTGALRFDGTSWTMPRILPFPLGMC